MAKHASHILDMVRKGAEHRCEELKGETAALMKNFPHLAGRKANGCLGRRQPHLCAAVRSWAPPSRADPHHRSDRCRPRRETLSALPSASVRQKRRISWRKVDDV